MKLNASASVTHTPAGTVTATPGVRQPPAVFLVQVNLYELYTAVEF